MSKNPFIVIEALDAGGSQTQTDQLAKRLKKEGYNPFQYHFPHEDRATGRLIYDKFLLEKNKKPFSRREQALLYIQDFFSRAEELWSIITKGKSKDIIVSDRFSTSTIAYQTIGLTGKQRTKMLEWINWLCFEGTPVLPKPDMVILLDTPVEVSWKHLADKKKDYFETKKKLAAIRRSYTRLAQEENWVVIQSMDAKGNRRSIEELHQEVWQNVKTVLS